MQSVVSVNDQYLIDFIKATKYRLVFISPGLSLCIAQALSAKWTELGPIEMQIILDVDESIYRLGYGTIEGLAHIDKAAKELGDGRLVCHQPGIRMGLAISDARVLSFSPLPFLVDSKGIGATQLNGIIFDSIPKSLADETGIGEHGIIARGIGQDKVPSTEILKVQESLRENPPQPFDITNKVRVFTAFLQFVEFKLKGCAISRKTVKIPSILLGLANNQKMQRLMQGQIKLIDKDSSLNTDAVLRLKDCISKRYLHEIPNFGTVLLVRDKDVFEQKVSILEKYIDRYQKRVLQGLQAQLDETMASLIKALLPAVKANIPKEWLKYLSKQPTDIEIVDMLTVTLKETFETADKLFDRMKVSYIYKGVTYQLLSNPEFGELVKKKIPTLRRLFDEYDAAPRKEK